MNLEELDYAQTRFGELILRRRKSPSLDGEEVYEVLLDGEYLMSSRVHASEVALAKLGLEAAVVSDGPVLVGGLGLGHTAAAALDREDVRQLVVVEALPQVLAWHRERRVPLGDRLMEDPRCRLVHDDFFELIAREPEADAPLYRSILVDIDHSPGSLLHSDHASFYDPSRLEQMARHLAPGGSFALWSADELEDPFVDSLGRALNATPKVHLIEFENPHTADDDRNWIAVIPRG